MPELDALALSDAQPPPSLSLSAVDALPSLTAGLQPPAPPDLDVATSEALPHPEHPAAAVRAAPPERVARRSDRDTRTGGAHGRSAAGTSGGVVADRRAIAAAAAAAVQDDVD